MEQSAYDVFHRNGFGSKPDTYELTLGLVHRWGKVEGFASCEVGEIYNLHQDYAMAPLFCSCGEIYFVWLSDPSETCNCHQCGKENIKHWEVIREGDV